MDITAKQLTNVTSQLSAVADHVFDMPDGFAKAMIEDDVEHMLTIFHKGIEGESHKSIIGRMLVAATLTHVGNNLEKLFKSELGISVPDLKLSPVAPEGHRDPRIVALAKMFPTEYTLLQTAEELEELSICCLHLKRALEGDYRKSPDDLAPEIIEEICDVSIMLDRLRAIRPGLFSLAEARREAKLDEVIEKYGLGEEVAKNKSAWPAGMEPKE